MAMAQALVAVRVGFELSAHKHNRYRRIGEQKELLDAIRSRYRRERGDARANRGSAKL
jgi:hypothetical protein